VLAGQRLISVPQYGEAVVEQDGRGVPVALPAEPVERSLAGEILPVPLAVTVIGAVVLDEPTGADNSEVHAEAARIVGNDALQFDRHVAGLVEHPQHRLPQRLRPPVGVPQGHP